MDSGEESTGPKAPAGARPTRLVAAGLIVVVAVAVVLVLIRGATPAASTGPTPAPAAVTSIDPHGFVLPRISGGGVIKLTGFRGKPLVVNFFASWCDPCRAELPGFSTVSHRLQGKVAFLGVNSEETGDGLGMARQFGIDWWPLARDVEGQNNSGLHDNLGGTGMPMTVFYDAAGKLLFVHPGQLAEDDLVARLHDLFGVDVPRSS